MFWILGPKRTLLRQWISRKEIKIRFNLRSILSVRATLEKLSPFYHSIIAKIFLLINHLTTLLQEETAFIVMLRHRIKVPQMLIMSIYQLSFFRISAAMQFLAERYLSLACKVFLHLVMESEVRWIKHQTILFHLNIQP